MFRADLAVVLYPEACSIKIIPLHLPSTPPFSAMHIYVQKRAVVFLALCRLMAFSMSLEPSAQPFMERTIGQFSLPNVKEVIKGETGRTIGCSELSSSFDASNFKLSPWSCMASALLKNQRRRQTSNIPGVLTAYAYFVEYDDDQGNIYSVIYPLELCPSNVVGDFTSPDGLVIPNATIQSIWTSLATLPADQLYRYTSNMVQTALVKYDAVIKPALCDPSASSIQGRMPRYQPSQTSGRISFTITGAFGLFGLAYGVLYVPIAKPGIAANITGPEAVAIAAASSTIGAFYYAVMHKLHTKEITNILDAFILTLVTTAFDGILKFFQHVWQGVCIGAATLGQAIGLLREQAEQGAVVIGDANPPGQPAVEMVPQNNPAAHPANPAQVQLGNVCPGT